VFVGENQFLLKFIVPPLDILQTSIQRRRIGDARGISHFPDGMRSRPHCGAGSDHARVRAPERDVRFAL
jgi:hypothetical protein